MKEFHEIRPYYYEDYYPLTGTGDITPLNIWIAYQLHKMCIRDSNWRDQKEIGKGATPHWMFGFNLNLKYRNFDLSSLFQGASGYTTFVTYLAETSFRFQNTWNDRTNDPDA